MSTITIVYAIYCLVFIILSVMSVYSYYILNTTKSNKTVVFDSLHHDRLFSDNRKYYYLTPTLSNKFNDDGYYEETF